MLRKILAICFVGLFCLTLAVGCNPPAGGEGAPAGSTSAAAE